MAYWFIPFTGLGGDTYEVRIQGAATNTQLVGGAQPFEVQEDDDFDVFMPVRTQSGYLRIVDTNDSTWRLLIPQSSTDRPVTVLKNGSVVWRGFIKPETYGSQFGVLPQERALAVVCPLSMLSGFDPSTSLDGPISFRDLILQAVQNVGLYNYYTQSQWIDDWLYCQLLASHIFERTDNGVVSRWNCLELLEHICRFFGISARMDGGSMVLTCLDMNDSSWQWDSFTVGSNGYGSAQNTEEILMGVRKATVTAKTGKNTTLVSFPTSLLETLMKKQHVNSAAIGTDEYQFITDPIFDYSDKDYEYHCYYGQGGYNGCLSGSDYFQGALADKHNYNWSYSIMINTADVGEQSADLPCTIDTKEWHVFPTGLLALNGEVLRNGKSLNVEGRLKMRVGIGQSRSTAKWWDGGSWTNTKSAFVINVGKGQGINSNRNLSSSFAAWNGWGIFINSEMYGRLFIDFLGVDYIQGVQQNEYYLDIANFNVEFVSNADNNEREENEYISENQTEYMQEKSVTLEFASYNNNSIGSGFLLNYDGTICRVLDYPDGTAMHPEQKLAARMTRMGGYTRRMLTLDLRESVVGSVGTMGKSVIDGSTFCVLSVSHQYRDDIETVKLLEL